MRQVTKACRCCLQYKGGSPKASLCPIVATTPLDLLHVDFTSIEAMMELDKSPRVANVLVFQDHFTKHVLAKFLYHPQTIGLVERSHKTIMCMIGKLEEDKKANRPSHLAEIVHAYIANQSTVTRYSPHYLMFGQQPRLLVDFVFPTIGSNEASTREASARNVNVYIISVRDQLRSALWEAQVQLTAEACQQKQYYDRKIGAMNLKPGDLVLVKADAWKGKGKIKDRWDEETWEVSQQIAVDVPSYKVTNQHGQSRVLH